MLEDQCEDMDKPLALNPRERAERWRERWSSVEEGTGADAVLVERIRVPVGTVVTDWQSIRIATVEAQNFGAQPVEEAIIEFPHRTLKFRPKRARPTSE